METEKCLIEDEDNNNGVSITSAASVARYGIEKHASSMENPSDMDMMKERYAKLLLGEDMSGGGKGVSAALAISNAITNLSASVFGELWRLEPLAEKKRAMWQREMEWLLAVSDHIVEFVPSHQVSADGTIVEVMITKPRSDLHMNLPALCKLDRMLLESLDSFSEAEFWYSRCRISDVLESDETMEETGWKHDEKWWLPTPKVPIDGLTIESRKHLRHERECISQVLKAALAINRQVLSEMDVPSVYWDTLPKNGKSSLGEAMYRMITAENFSPEYLLSRLDSSNEHSILDIANRIEAVVHIWRRKVEIGLMHAPIKDGKSSSSSWAASPKNSGTSIEKREVYKDRAESLLMMLRHKFPGLPQTILDISKIQHNKDVGQSILESYSRVLESLAFNILSRIDNVLEMNDEAVSRSRMSTSAKSSCASPSCFCPPLLTSKANAIPLTQSLVSKPTLGWMSPTKKKALLLSRSRTTAGNGLDIELRHMLHVSRRQESDPVRVTKAWSYCER